MSRFSKHSLILLPLIGLIFFVTAYPVVIMFVKSFASSRPGLPTTWGLQGWTGAFGDASLLPVLANTFSLALVRTALTTTLAIYFAWVVARTDTPLKGLIEFALWLGFFLPLLPMTMGWILLLDSHYGLLNKALINIFNLSVAPFNVYSYWGIIWCHLAFSTSVRFLLLTPAFRSMDAALEEAALVSGSNTVGSILRITIPILAPAILASSAIGFVKSLESFEIELVLGVPAGIYVLPTRIYEFIRWEPPLYDRATALSSIFLVVIFGLFLLQKLILGGRDYTTVSGRAYIARPLGLGKWRWLTFASCASFIVITIVLPMISLLVGTFMEVFGFFNLGSVWTIRHWASAFRDPVFSRSLMNTLILGLGASLLGTSLYILLSYVIARSKLPGNKLIDLLTWLPWALPGVLISFALLWVVLGSGDLLRPLYGTVSVLILAMIIKEMPIGSQIIKTSILQIGRELEEASAVSGATKFTTCLRILIPLLMPTLSAVAIIMFIASVREIPAVVFLSSSRSRTISLLMLDAVAEANMERAMILGVFIVMLTLVLLVFVRLLRSRLRYY